MASAYPMRAAPTWLHSIPHEWRAFRTSRRGQRFERRYRRARRTPDHDKPMPRFFRVVLALLAFAVGAGTTFTPVPALPFFLISGALLAEESLTVARILDRFEWWLWRRWKRARRRYGLTPVGLRWAAIILALGLTAFSGSLCYFAWAR